MNVLKVTDPVRFIPSEHLKLRYRGLRRCEVFQEQTACADRYEVGTFLVLVDDVVPLVWERGILVAPVDIAVQEGEVTYVVLVLLGEVHGLDCPVSCPVIPAVLFAVMC